MRKMKLSFAMSLLLIATLIFVAADHIDAPNVRGGSSDITDFYAFQGENTDNIVFVANMQGLMSPEATANAEFDENVMIEFNIDTNNDNIEDLVIQAIPKNKKMYFRGPIVPSQTGLVSTFDADNSGNAISFVKITSYGENPNIKTTQEGIKLFAGPRDDPFFMDFAQFSAIVSGNATGFNNPGDDTFKGSNVLSVVVEVPKSMVGSTGTINTWVESKRRQ